MKPTWPDESAAENHRPAGQSDRGLIWLLLILVAVGALNSIRDAAFVIAAVLPFFLIVRWRFWGLLASVLGGWALVHHSHVSFTWNSYMMPFFMGQWMVFGWLFMLVWCSPIYLVVILWRWIQRVRQRRG